ncbi:hypothetical protein CEE37_01550 [candidate division LCP-89 bacterium B3_LCP]|uniref:Histidine kinase/HSP90-like ATPase domain-containing protein n=1 Tax=candidate division LCP-89 bacterium B3_LCP TaxID=2012998 RepID=A0A532V5B1_UNCL8|nr:MAG: hypothetical protein CEE37_01550 [candidate division LCP-89 bacterium B3_LCP]
MPLRKIGELTVPSDPAYLEKVDQYSDRLFKKLPLGKNDLDDIAIAISEAVNNAMVHGNGLDADRNVHISYYLSARYLRIAVRDEGEGFIPDNVPDPTESENLLKVSGRGLLIIRHLMDRIECTILKNGMKMTLDKFFTEG